MNHVERFRAVMDFQPVDRLPRWEWAMWWDETIARWKREGLPAELETVFDRVRNGQLADAGFRRGHGGCDEEVRSNEPGTTTRHGSVRSTCSGGAAR